MRIKKLELKNFRGFEDLTIDFPEQEAGLAVFVGVNGSGKTSVLEGVARALKSVQDGLIPNSKDDFDTGFYGNQVRIITHQLGSRVSFETQSKYRIAATLLADGKAVNWHFGQGGGNSGEIVPFTSNLRRKIQDGSNDILPMLAYYTINRYWKQDIMDVIELYSSGSRLDTYKDCLNPKVSSLILYEWFKRMELIHFQKRGALPPELEDVQDAIITSLEELFDEGKGKAGAYFSGEHDEVLINTGNGNWFPFRLLSDGYRNMLGIVADIAYRMAELNPHERLKTQGIVIIDEIELHLHPAWQRRVIKALRRTFPNIQFILTTHSPQVLSTLKKENVFILEDFKLVKETPHTYGRDSNSILWDIFGVEKRPAEAKKEINKLYRLMDDPKKVKETESMLQELGEKYGYYDEEMVRARAHFQTLNEA